MEADYISYEIKRYCDLTINYCFDNNEIGNSSECIIYEIDLEYINYFKKKFFEMVCKISGASIIPLDKDEELSIDEMDYLLRGKIKYYNNVFSIECEIFKYDKTFDVYIYTILEKV